MQWSSLLPPAAETTSIPLDGEHGRIGALMYLACLAYPATSPMGHRKRDAYMIATGEYLDGASAYAHGRRRRRKGSQPTYQTRQRLFNVLNTADNMLRQRMKLADMLYNLRGRKLVKEAFSTGILRITINGPISLSKALEGLDGRSSRSWWRVWRQSLPVMHLALALRHAAENVNTEPGPYSLNLVRHQSEWLPEAIRRLSFEAHAIRATIPAYRAEHRIDLVPQ